jgi:glycerophosphoryl diester phosphodiesterase
MIKNLLLSLFLVLPMVHAESKKAATAKGDWNVTSHVPLEKFKIQSHRGAGVLAPENTLDAFQHGWKMGTIPESDLRTTKDGVIVAFHDANFSRVVKNASEELKKKGVQDLTFAELSKLDVSRTGSNSFSEGHVSKMTEVFALMKGHPERELYLDIKNVDFKELASEVKQFGIEKQVILASTKYDQIHEWKSLVPESQTLLWMGGDEKKLKGRFAELRKANFADVTQLQIHNSVNKSAEKKEPFALSRKFLVEAGKEVRSHGILYQTLPWDTFEEQAFHTLLDYGFESFSTDYPDAALKAVKSYYEKKK